MHLKTFQRKELNIVQKTLEPTEATENVLLKLFSKVVQPDLSSLTDYP